MHKLLNVDEAAVYLGTSVRFVRRLVAERRIPFHHIGRHVRFDERDLATYVRAGRIEAIRPAPRHGKEVA
ncbi:MAG TPA: helix-turn-helix domain-containing protein [Micromonosporaceae bacterium]|jgi:excisionase family DNA binding protein